MRRIRNNSIGDSRQELGEAVFAFSFLIVFSIIWFNKLDFSQSMALIFGAVITIIVLYVLFLKLKYRLRKNHLDLLLSNLRRAGQEENLKNFISRFGLEGQRNEGWSFRNHNFDWNRINDLKKMYREMGITSDEKDIYSLLRVYIQEKEENLTRESISKEPQKFNSLTGTEFEKLLYRLFQAMDYKVQLTGKSGDQGGDLVANRNGDRVLIQAKRYSDWSTGNAAVQQVVGAMKYYDCNRAMVVTTSYFTPEAISLAKANKTELISKERLQELLLEYLGESWS